MWKMCLLMAGLAVMTAALPASALYQGGDAAPTVTVATSIHCYVDKDPGKATVHCEGLPWPLLPNLAKVSDQPAP